MFSPGTDVNAEVYDVEIKNTLLIQKMLFFKKIRKEYSVPKGIGLEDGVSEGNNGKFYIYFYYKPENQIVIISVAPNIEDKNKSKVAFIAINQGLDLGNWKEINYDFDSEESKKEKEKFEERIFKSLNINYCKITFW